ncbi:MAG: hypothetical protein HY291_01220 [Planctomycetes bacterium]|nr:hypothetical protein [Planctomycetota bacterium]
MGLPPIQVQLSKFEQLEILRQEIELREEEFKQTEKYIRTIMWEVERQKYLQSIHPLFQQLQPPAEAASLVQFTANREALQSAIDVMKLQLQALEAETRGQAVPPGLRASMPQRPGAPSAAASAAGGIPGAAKRKFDSFDDFRTQRPGGPPKT